MNEIRKHSLSTLHRFQKAFGATVLILAISACATSKAPSPVYHTTGKVFATPEQAVDAYVSALRGNKKPELLKILGSDGKAIVNSGDTMDDANGRSKFLADYDEDHEIDYEDDDRASLVVGDAGWPLSIPLIRVKGGWQWDTKAGKQEILNHRIERNELMANTFCRATIDAQHDFAAQHGLPNGRTEYAQRMISKKGKRDGLYWPVLAGEEKSPLGPMIVETETGRVHTFHMPYYGYDYKILKRQGPNAVGGAHSYMANGHMTGGFALLAYPARYGDSGIKTFVVGEDGVVYEKDLGPRTTSIAAAMAAYDPDNSWKISEPED